MNKLRRLALLVSLGMIVFFAQAQQAQLISAMIDGCTTDHDGAGEWVMLYSGGSSFTANTTNIQVFYGTSSPNTNFTGSFRAVDGTSNTFVTDLNDLLGTCNFSFVNSESGDNIPAGSHILIFNDDVLTNGSPIDYDAWCSAYQSGSSIYVLFSTDTDWPTSNGDNGLFDNNAGATRHFRSVVNSTAQNFTYDDSNWGSISDGNYLTWNDGQSTPNFYSNYTGCRPSDLNALPVVLLNFDAVAMEDHISIWWSTAEELGNSHFIIERSANAMQWERIGMVGGHGTTQEVQHYEFKDQSPLPGRSYYRLTQVDFNGDSETFDIVAVDFDSEDTQLKVFPNPSSDFITVNCSEEIEHLSMIDTRGRTHQIAQEGSSGMNGRFDIRHLPNGIYRVMIYGKKTVFREKLIKVD